MRAVLSALLILITFNVIPGANLALGNQTSSTVCELPERPALNPRYRSDNLQIDPIPLSGMFPDEVGMEPSTDVHYQVEQFGSDVRPQAPRVVFDETEWVDVNGRASIDIGDLESLSIPELSSVTDFLQLWSECSTEIPSALVGLYTDFGFGWITNPGDPFMARSSPASFSIAGGTLSETVGSLPLGIYEARWISETRIGMVIASGAWYDENGNVGANYSQGSVWVLVMTERGWRVDAIIGLVQIRDSWTPLFV